MFKKLLKLFFQENGRHPNPIEMLQIKFRAASLANRGKVIPFKHKRDFAAEIKSLIDDGTIKVGEVTKKNDNVLQREMFRDSNLNKTVPIKKGTFNSQLNRNNAIDQGIEVEPVSEDFIKYTIQDIKKKNPIEGMKISNQIIRREGEFKDLTKEQSQRILKDTEDWIFQRDPADTWDYKKNRPFRDDPDFDPEDMASGGRAGYSLGSLVNQARQQGDGIESRLEQLGGDVTSAEQLLQELNQRLESAGSSVPEGGGASIANYTPAAPAGGYLGGGLGTLATLAGSNQPFNPMQTPPESLPVVQPPPPGVIQTPLPEDKNFFMGNMNPYMGGPNDKLTPIDPYKNTMLGGLSQDGQRFDSVQSAWDSLAEQTRKQREINPHTRDVVGTELYQGDKGFENFTNYFNKVNDPSYTAPSPQLLASSQQNLQKALPGLFAKGGRAGFYTGGITDVKPSLDDIGHGSDSLMSRTRLMSPGSQATTSTGLNYLLAEDNDNIRVPFAGGGSDRMMSDAEKEERAYNLMRDAMDREKFLKRRREEMEMDRKRLDEKRYGIAVAEGGRIGFAGGGDPRRRAFLKLFAALGAGIAGLKTGILGFGGKGAAKKAVTESLLKQSAGSGNPPPYFFKLVEKIKLLGDDTLATQDKAIAKKYKDYTMQEDFAGNIEIIKKNNNISEDVYMSYKVDEVPLKKGGSKKVEDYEEFTARPDGDGKMKNVEQGVPDEVVNEGSVFDDDYIKFSTKEIEKADGGRIGFGGGLLAKLAPKGGGRKFLERVFGKERFKTMIENDPEMHQGMLEVVEMFRNKDKEGLKMYMQKYLPHMDDAEIEAFVVGSGDTSGIKGQLIRLGSGRDYKGKLDMIEEADNIRKLKNFDIEGVSKNAEGGRIEMRGGGDALKALIKFFANKEGKRGSTYLKNINPKVLPEGIETIMGPGHLKALQKNQTDYVESLLKIIKSDKKFLNNLKANADEAIAQAPIGMESFAKEITESIKRDAMKGSRFERMKVYDKIDIDDAIVDVEQMIKNRRVKESDGRALNASGGIQTMLGE